MAKVDVLEDRKTQPAIPELRAADILIAIPTFNNEATIASVLKAARAALFQFPGRKVVIAQVDGGSSDSTIALGRATVENEPSFVQMSYPIFTLHKLEVSHHPVPGKDSAYRTIFALAADLDAKACCIVGADNPALTPDWIASLVQPILESDFDLAAPFYQRHKQDGLLVNGILYPAVRALFGKRIRQPVGSDFAYSRALLRQCASTEAWKTESVQHDVDLRIIIQAIQSNLKLCQVRLGLRRSAARERVLDVSSIVASLAGALYGELERTADLWQRVRASSPVPTFGLRFDQDADEPAVEVKPMLETFRIGYQNLQDIWSLILPPAALLELKRLSRQSHDQFRFPNDLWARTVYDFALAYRLRTIGREHLLGAFAPLYMGWVASFILSVRELSSSQTEDEIENLCITYESQKAYLISRWRWPDRFMP